MTRPVRTVLPLSIVTCTSMLAMDLYLPAVPTLQRSMGVDVTLAQGTVAIFLAGLAASQVLWAEAMARLGPRRSIGIAVSLLALAAVGCALARDIEVLLAMRLVQGLAAGAATVVAPSVVRSTLAESDAIRGIAAISTIEALVPAGVDPVWWTPPLRRMGRKKGIPMSKEGSKRTGAYTRASSRRNRRH
jgi:DHA1 family bicyclomycin/chloramphenicol resistance-like MFS transporter